MRSMKMAALSAVLTVAATVGAQQYHVVNLGTLGGGYSQANGINDNGEVVGYSSVEGAGYRRAFKWTQGGGMQNLVGYDGDGDDYAWDLNNSGTAVGTADNGTLDTGVKWVNGQPVQNVAFPNLFSHARDINNAGNIAGVYYSNTVAQGGFVVGDQSWTMPLAQGQDGSFANAINKEDVIAGYRFTLGQWSTEAVLWRPFFGVTSLGTLGGSASAHAINDHEQITGFSRIGDPNSPQHAFSWTQATGMISIHGLADKESSLGHAIDNSGTIVGVAFNDVFTEQSAFIWKADTGMLKLDSLLDIESQGWTIWEAMDINENGQIVGRGFHPRYGQRALLLNPVPEPGTMAALGLGAVALLRRRRKD